MSFPDPSELVKQQRAEQSKRDLREYLAQARAEHKLEQKYKKQIDRLKAKPQSYSVTTITTKPIKQSTTKSPPTAQKSKPKKQSKTINRLLKSLNKKVVYRKILKSNKMEVHIKELPKLKTFDSGSSFFNDEWEAEKSQLNPFKIDKLFWS